MSNVTLRIEQDEHAESPRTMYEGLGTMVCFHGGYTLGDKHDYASPDELHDAMKRDKLIALPLFLFDHSGITISTTPFSCPWDSGQVGYIVLSREKAREAFMQKRITKKLEAKILESLASEVAEYDKYLQGDVWGYVIEDDKGDELDSCWGYIGREYCEEDAKAEFAYWTEAYRPDYQI